MNFELGNEWSSSAVQTSIDRGGFHLSYFPGIRGKPEYCHSTGFLMHGHPELLVFGLHPTDCETVFYDFFLEVLEGRPHPVGRERSFHMQCLPLRLLPVPVEHWVGERCFLRGIDRYYSDKPGRLLEMSVLQLVLPDYHERFPWDSGYDGARMGPQPILCDGDVPGWDSSEESARPVIMFPMSNLADDP